MAYPLVNLPSECLESRHQVSERPCVFSTSSVALRHTAAVPHFVLLPVSLFPVYRAVIC